MKPRPTVIRLWGFSYAQTGGWNTRLRIIYLRNLLLARVLGFTIYWWTSTGLTTYWKFPESVFDSFKVSPTIEHFPLVFKWLVSLFRQVNQLSKQRISKMLLSICSLFTSMSLRLAVICSNVLANGCYQFAVYSIHWCSNGAINLQLSATMYSQTVDTVPCNNALANGCYKFAAYWLPILSQQMGDVD